MTQNKSIAFSRTIGVFQGGGVCGAAFAGAYEEAKLSGINFEGTIGASAGSITASLIAAGGAPELLNEALSDNLLSLLQPAASKMNGFEKAAYSIFKVFNKNLCPIIQQVLNLGLYSSIGLEKWIESYLSKCLPNVAGKIRFKHLPKPLAIISTNLTQGTYKIWSQRRTPESSVSFAVRCSCAIPFFFQPVETESALHVDGGVVANLPLFLVPELDLPQEIPSLYFRLISERGTDSDKIFNAKNMLFALVDTVLKGVSDVQLSMSTRRQVIDIDTGKTKATEFGLTRERINELVELGRIATRNFVTEEQIRIVSDDYTAASLDGSRERLLDRTAELIEQAKESVRIFAGDLSWLEELYIHLLDASLRGVSLELISSGIPTPQSNINIAALNAIGCKVKCTILTNHLAGTLIDDKRDYAQAVLVENLPQRHGRLCRSPRDSNLIKHLSQHFMVLWEQSNQMGTPTVPELLPVRDGDIVRALKQGVPQYTKCDIEVRRVALANTTPLSKYVNEFRLNRARLLDSILSKNGLQGAAQLKRSPWPITPPVLEQIATGDFLVIDGTHRIYTGKQDNLIDCKMVVVVNKKPNLPASPSNWNNIKIVSDVRPRSEHYTNFNEENFRPIKVAFRDFLFKGTDKETQ